MKINGPDNVNLNRPDVIAGAAHAAGKPGKVNAGKVENVAISANGWAKFAKKVAESPITNLVAIDIAKGLLAEGKLATPEAAMRAAEKIIGLGT